jgi:hypothetical protein
MPAGMRAKGFKIKNPGEKNRKAMTKTFMRNNAKAEKRKVFETFQQVDTAVNGKPAKVPKQNKLIKRTSPLEIERAK